MYSMIITKYLSYTIISDEFTEKKMKQNKQKNLTMILLVAKNGF